jgi:signal transduction histidine kinase
MPTFLRTLRPWLEPAVGALFFALWCVAEAGRFRGNSIIVSLALVAIAIALSRVRPIVSLALVVGVVTLQVLQVLSVVEATTWPIAFGVLFVVFVTALEAPRLVSRIALGLGLPLSAASGYLIGLGFNSWVGAGAARNQLEMWLMVSALSLGLYAGAWAIGTALRVSLRELRALVVLRATSAQLVDVEVELTMTRERDRIARDVHDVLAHSLAVVLAQADGARFLSETKPERADAAFRSIADAARAALIDVRTLVEGMREDQGDQPQPGISDIEPLLAQMAGAGMTVERQTLGTAQQLTPAQQLAVFRIVQESLTNSLRHADRGSATRLSFDWNGPGLVVAIVSEGTTGTDDAAAGPVGAGHGIRGMKDRARLAGGWLTAEREGDEFVVTAFVPTAREAAGTQLELAE